ncbi:hypothetical protein T4B_15172 [Trichinella pseudospiralis]|uniref:Uncharacterized protein n=1 Tax=Trichinella pseudospiralis TaxID=6337 RepID=A0A0V1IB53_TRIPS|nr:hypothetical protein T4B_15172 [Trichinella pseudospiralis]
MLVQKREPYIEDKLSGSNSRTAVDCIISDAQARRSHRLTAKPKSRTRQTRFQRDDRHSVKIVNPSALLTLHSITRWIDLSDPQSSIGQEGQSTDLCLQANPHTIRFPCLVTDTVAKCRIKNAALLICRFWDYCTSRSQLKQS